MGKKSLSPDEVRQLLSGGRPPSTTTIQATAKPTTWRPRYDRCAVCTITQPMLVGFSGDTDWEPQIAIDDPIRVEIKILRETTGRRTILLCTDCIEALRSARDLTPDHVENGQLTLI